VVLLAEDNADMRDYVGRLLSEQYRVITAKNGEEAFEIMQKVKPDLLLSDVMMPKLDGFGLLQKVRLHPRLRTTPVILLSARAGEESKLEGLKAGADDYLVKPFSARELIARVDANLRINAARHVVERELASFLMQAPFAIVILSGPDYVIDLVNDQSLPIIQRSREEVLGRPAAEVAPEGLKRFKSFLDEILETGEPAVMNEQESRIDRNGTIDTAYLTIAFQPLRRLDGHAERIMIVVEDVTDRVLARRRSEQYAALLEAEVKKRTQELNQLNATLRQSNEDLRQFAHVASHDLKEPVRKVKVFAGRLEDDPATTFSAKARSYLGKINSAASRMLTMIEGVLHYSTINSTAQQTEAVDLNRVITAIESDLEVPIAEKKATVHYSGLPTVEGAALLLYQLFYNLINNSLKFSRANEPCRIDITAAVENDQAVIILRDNGIGFDQEESERIFDSFSRLNTRDKYEGTGLGLALCKKIAVRHGGDIEATGKKGIGSEFHIRLPLKGGIGRVI
ncbi:MAG TPA: response regulator, partial [Puia sp.]|nr:response regulator [Puia sp.]